MEGMAINEDCTTSDDGNASDSNSQNLRLLSRKRNISASAVESEPIPQNTGIKRKRQKLITESFSIIRTGKSLDDLPPEMLEAVLRNLPTPDLLNCRQFNRKFNEIASQVMRRRADIQLYFSAGTEDGQFMQTIQYRNCSELLVNICEPYEKVTSKTFTEFVACLKVAKNFPITSFRFDDLSQSRNDMESFLSIWGMNIVALNVSVEDVESDVEILCDLLLKRVPNLKKIEIYFGWEIDPATIELVADSNEFQFPNLQVLRTSTFNRKNRPMIANILKAAPNLNNFYYFRDSDERWNWNMPDYNGVSGIEPDELAMIKTLNKAHCVKDLQIQFSEDLICFLVAQRINFKLESLAVSLQPFDSRNKQLKSSAALILNQIFQSSKDVIQTLRIEPLGFLGPDLNIPEMKNLRKLELFESSYLARQEQVGIFLPPFEMADNFPNLKELTLNGIDEVDDLIFRTSQLKPMPSIEILRIIDRFSAECEENLLKATPNVKTLVIEENDLGFNNEDRSLINFRLVANCLPKLHSFGWLTTRRTHRSLLHSLDAAITGLPVEFCKKISKKFCDRESLSADELASYQLEQRSPSILDLNELKQFDFNIKLDEETYANMDALDEWVGCARLAKKKDESGFSPGDVFYKTGFSKVSKFLAFDLMPNLHVRTHRYLSED